MRCHGSLEAFHTGFSTPPIAPTSGAMDTTLTCPQTSCSSLTNDRYGPFSRIIAPVGGPRGAPARPSVGGCAARQGRPPRARHATYAAAANAALAGRQCARAAAVAARSSRSAASTTGRRSARRRRCDVAAACVNTPNGAGCVAGKPGARPGKRGGSGGGGRWRERPRMYTQACAGAKKSKAARTSASGRCGRRRGRRRWR